MSSQTLPMAEKVTTCLSAARPTAHFSGRSWGLCPVAVRFNSTSFCSLDRSRSLTRPSIRNATGQLIKRPRDVASERSACSRLHTKYWRKISVPIVVDGHPAVRKTPCGRSVLAMCRLKVDSENEVPTESVEKTETRHRTPLQTALWFTAAGYVIWLFILPYAPGDPVWAISPETISMLINLSLNFFYVLPILNAGGIHVIESPVVHPTAEALFNFVIGWTVMFAPLLFTDRKRDRFGGPLELLWIIQLFLTNTVLIPYMAIRLNAPKVKNESSAASARFLHLRRLSSAMISGALPVAVTGSVIGVLTVLWFLLGRDEFGSFQDRWDFFTVYFKSDRVAYAFLWDLVLYSAFQPWLIGDNLSNLDDDKVDSVSKLRFVPYIGLIAYLWSLHGSRKLED